MRFALNDKLVLEDEDIILIALIWMIWTDENSDKYLLGALIFIFISGLDKDLLL